MSYDVSNHRVPYLIIKLYFFMSRFPKTIFLRAYVLYSFLIGICNAQAQVDWHSAQWIGYQKDDRPQEWSIRDLNFNSPPQNINLWTPTSKDKEIVHRTSFISPLLRKAYTLDRAVTKAEVSVAGVGLYELYINGEKVGDQVLQPAQSAYNKQVFYTTYDISSLLVKGENIFGVMLGNGFYGQTLALGGQLFYGAPRVMMVAHITYSDGTTTSFVSDENWKASSGPILLDNIYLGETYDARKENDAYFTSKFEDKDWDSVELMPAPGGLLMEQKLEPMRKVRGINPVSILPAETGWIVDLGQNMTGWLQIRVKESEGDVIKMCFAEHLMPDKQNIDPASTGIHVTGGIQTDYYICKSNEWEEWEPRFTYHGFRYVQIEGLSQKPELDQFTGWLVRTDASRIGHFECSDSLLNKYYNVSMWTIEDNIQGLLSDCPHRERCAWMGDACVVAEAASYNFDLQQLWKKMSYDISTTLGVAGRHFKDPFPKDKRAPANIAVGKRLCLQARPDWGAATVMVPWFCYLYYADIEVIEESWNMMTGWIDYLDEKVQVDGIIDGGYGDWCPPGSNSEMDTPPAFTSTALYYYSLIAMDKMAQVMGKDIKLLAYLAKAETVKKAFNAKYFDKDKGGYMSQTANAFALYTSIVPEGMEQSVADLLAKQIMAKQHYTTGIFGHRALYTVLNDYGHEEVSQHLLHMTSYPSLGFMTETHGLTTWPETQNNWKEGERYWRCSFNHPMQSSFAASFHESLGGIRPNSDFPGFEHFILKPIFISDLDWVKVNHISPFGEIKSSWKRNGNLIEWTVSIPSESCADVDLSTYKDKVILLDGEKHPNRFKLNEGQFTIVITD